MNYLKKIKYIKELIERIKNEGVYVINEYSYKVEIAYLMKEYYNQIYYSFEDDSLLILNEYGEAEYELKINEYGSKWAFTKEELKRE